MQHARIGIIGGGVAGLACAYFLAERGIRDCVVWERADTLGTHASGRSAAMGRQFSLSDEWMPLAAEGLQFLYAPPPRVSERPLITPIGSLLIYPRTLETVITAHLAHAHRYGIPATRIRAAEAHARVPAWQLSDDACVMVWTPSDGIVDVERFVAGLAHAVRGDHANRICTSTTVRSILRTDAGWLLDTNQDAWQVDVLVNAAGAWSDAIARAAGVTPLGLQSFARRISICAPTRGSDSFLSLQGEEVRGFAQWPFVWDHRHDLYVRPDMHADTSTLWSSACEEIAADTWDPATVDAALPAVDAHHALAQKFRAAIPALADATVLRSWTGLRTFTPSRTAHVAWATGGAPFFWLCGLGGHGITCAASLGRLAAERITSSLRGV